MATKTDMSVHDLLQNFYKTSGHSFSPYAKAIDWFARRHLEKAHIFKNLSRAKRLRKRLDQALSSRKKDEKTVNNNFNLGEKLNCCYDDMVDDLLLMAAFENHAKAVLLKKGYVVHLINEPKTLKKRQKKCPVHIKTVRAEEKKNTNVKFSAFTIGLGQLLNPTYLKCLSIQDQIASCLKEIHKRRNEIHLQTSYVFNVTSELLATVGYLDSTIPENKMSESKK